MKDTRKCYSKRSRKGFFHEFPFTLYLLFLLFVFPLVNLVGLATGAATTCLIAHQSASRAAAAQRYDKALEAANAEATAMLKTGFASFAKLSPAANSSSGVDLYIVSTDYRKGGSKWYGPNTPVPNQVDPSTYLYECAAKASYKVGPIISMSNIPWIGKVPGIGTPVVLSFTANRASEYPMGLNQTSNPTNTSGGTIPNLNIPWDDSGNPAGSSWNYANLYDIITADGITPYDDDVVVVDAKNQLWTATHFVLGANDHIFFDTRTDGGWSHGNSGTVGPNGISGVKAPDGLPELGLIAKIGDGQPFFIGAYDLNLVPPPKTSGRLYLACNSGMGPLAPPGLPVPPAYSTNKGAQFVRIVVGQ